MPTIRHVAFIGAFDPTFPRIGVMIDGLRQQGIEVVICSQPMISRSLRRIWHNFRASIGLRNIDVVIIPAFNQLTAPLTWVINRALGRVVICDYLVGLKDVHIDRASLPSSLIRRIFYNWVEKIILTKLVTLTDTAEHIAYFAHIHNLQPNSMSVLPVGARQVFVDARFPPNSGTPTIVQYLGSYIPFHGVETILHTAALLQRDTDIHFELIGAGQTLSEMRKLAEKLTLRNTTFIAKYLRPPMLFQHLKRANIFLGVFGSSTKTNYVVPIKIYELIGLGRPLITADSAPLRAHFRPGEHLLTVPPDDPAALSAAIRQLATSHERREQLANQARTHLCQNYTPAQIGKTLRSILEREKSSQAALPS